MKKNISCLLIIFLYSLLIGFYLFKPGFYYTQDIKYHILRTWQLIDLWKQGIIFSRWAPNFDAGHGLPIFNFYYPGLYFLTAALSLFTKSIILAIKIQLYLSLLLSGIFMYLFAKKFWGSLGALVSAVFYMFAPYHLLDLYVRGSLGELWAIAFLPMILYFFHLYQKIGKKKYLFLTIIFWALMILFHNIFSLIFSVIILFFILMQSYKNKSSFIKISVIFLFALGITSFFWIPAVLETKYIAGYLAPRFSDHFVYPQQLFSSKWEFGGSWPGSNDNMSFQLGWVHLLGLFLSLSFFFLPPQKKTKYFSVFAFFWILAIGSVFMTLKYSQFFWSFLPFFDTFQFPWRFLSVFTFSSSFLSGFVLVKFPKTFVAALLLLMTVFSYFPYTIPNNYQKKFNDKLYTLDSNWPYSTTCSWNECRTIWAKKPRNLKDAGKLQTINGGKLNILKKDSQSLSYTWQVFSEKNIILKLGINYFPGWFVYIDKKPAVIDYKDNGLISFKLPASHHLLEVKFKGSFIQKSANIISVVSLAILFFYLLFRSKKKK